MLFSRKPDVVEAVQVLPATYNGHDWSGPQFSETPDWLSKAIQDQNVWHETPVYGFYVEWFINTSTGAQRAVTGDYIVCASDGELRPYKATVFLNSYHPTP